MPEVRSVFAEHVAQGFYINVEVESARGRSIRSVPSRMCNVPSPLASVDKISRTTSKAASAIPSMFGMRSTFATLLNGLRQVLLATPSGAQIPLDEVARVSILDAVHR